MGRALKYAGEYRSKLYWATLLIFIGVMVSLIPYLVASVLVVDFFENNPLTFQELGIAFAICATALVIKSGLQAYGLKLSHIAAFGTLYNMRMRFAKDVANHSFGDIEKVGTGKYRKAFTDDINNLERLFAHFIPEGMPNIFLIILVYVYIFSMDTTMGFLSLAAIPVGLIPTIVSFRRGLKMMPEYYEVKAKLNDTIIEYIGGMEVVKVFGATGDAYARYMNAVDTNRDKTLGWWKGSWILQSVVGAGLPCTVILTLPVGLYLYTNGQVSLEVFILTLMLNLCLGEPLTKFINFLPFFPTVSYAVENLENLFVREGVCCGLRTDMPDNFDVEFKNVRFAYDETDVLKDLNIKFKADSLTALVGESGCGKSTIAKLMVHYWDANDGSINVGGVDLREYANDVYMSQISYVAQDTHLFSGTIAENIAMGKDGATREDIIRVARSAACHDFIMQLSNGYDTQVGDLGGMLSGGERQRITIARALLKDAPIVILDEATAFADAENESLIQQALSELLKGKTAVVIAHRLNTIVHADNIVVLADGHVDTQGTHEELLQNSKLYKKLWDRCESALDWNLEV